MRIMIGADLVPTESNRGLFTSGDAAGMVGAELLSLLQGADYRIFNLEVPLTDTVSPIRKNGPNLIAPPETVNGYCALGVDLLTLANNHILDQGAQGLTSTLSLLREKQIAHVGVGKDLNEASAPYIFPCGSRRVGIYACAEHEFSIASEQSPGANPFDPLESPDHVAELKKQCDYVIVLYHGGKEHYRYPSPMLRKTCRKLVEKGADLVICQHSHCIGCEETYRHGTIVYGQGNFLFDHNPSDFWKTSLLIEFTADGVCYHPLVKAGNTVRLADGVERNEILQAFRARSEQIRESGFVEATYREFAQNRVNNYVTALSWKDRLLFHKAINKLSKGSFYRKYALHYAGENGLRVRNYTECEAHRELLLTGIETVCRREEEAGLK